MLVANLFGFGNPVELAIIAGVVMVLFGASKVGQFGKSLGEGLKEFKKATRDGEDGTATPVAPPATTSTPAPNGNNLNSPEAPKQTDEVGEVEKTDVAGQSSKE